VTIGGGDSINIEDGGNVVRDRRGPVRLREDQQITGIYWSETKSSVFSVLPRF